jgi:hypothetical protein
MDSVECLTWNGNKTIFEQKYSLIADPKEPKTVQEKAKRIKKFDAPKVRDSENRIAYGTIIYDILGRHHYDSGLPREEYAYMEFDDDIQYIQTIVRNGGVYYAPLSELLERWLKSQTCYEYSKFLIKNPVVKKYSKWGWDVQCRRQLLPGRRYNNEHGLSSVSRYVKFNDVAVFDKYSVQTSSGEIWFGMIYLPYLKITKNSTGPATYEHERLFCDDSCHSIEKAYADDEEYRRYFQWLSNSDPNVPLF